MTRAVRRIAALTCGALAWPGPALAHGGAPVRIVADRPAGPYVVSVWAAPDVGAGMLWVVYAARDGAPFVAPTAVRVGVAPVSRRAAEVLHDARPERVGRGARFVAHVAFDRGGAWRVRVVTEGPAGGGEVRARVTATPAGAPGPVGLALYASPFVLVAGVWRRAALVRRRPSGRGVALTSA
jgi:hypothetical protein